MSNSVDPDETAHYEPSHLELCCLQKPILSHMAVKELTLSMLGNIFSRRYFEIFFLFFPKNRF